MKNRFHLLLLCIVLSFAQQLRADEGMWLPMFVERLNYIDMQKQGLKLTPEELYSINHSSLKDAIVHFGGGCTGEIVSAEGLLFTNHHCGYPNIQAHSSIDHDYLTEGFWAKSKAEELPNQGLTVKFLVRIDDVTKTILSQVNENMTETQRNDKIREIAKKLESDAAKDNKFYDARVASFFNGNEYYLFVYEVFKDVRLVGAPPSSIGKFGADSDNWMWPRQTGDFSVFRVYADKNNNPAEYSKDNVPYKPKHFLPISIKGLKQDDFTFIMGYPGTTDRYASSHTIEWTTDYQAPALVKVRTQKLNIMLADMQANPDVRIKYASKYASSSNYWKFFQGQTKGLKALHVEDRKAELENQFASWISKDANRKNEYGNAVQLIDDAYKTIDKYEIAIRYTNEAIWRGTEIIAFARQFSKFFENPAAVTDKGRYTKAVSDYFKDYNAPTDQKVFAAMLEMFYTDVPKDQQPPIMEELYKKYKGNWTELAKKAFEKSIFADQHKMEEAVNTGNNKGLDKDPVWQLQKAFADHGQKLGDWTKDAYDQLAKGRRLYVKGLREMQPDTKFYPDANSTMRLTYGSVQGYDPADGIRYRYYTTLKGVMEKEDPKNWEFVVPAKLKQLYETKDYGPYGENGDMPVGFITNNDITGGNSGSPVINANGELVGLAFDGNWEAMSCNYAFEPNLQRTVCVDARYVLFIIDKYAGATNLIKELDIRK